MKVPFRVSNHSWIYTAKLIILSNCPLPASLSSALVVIVQHSRAKRMVRQTWHGGVSVEILALGPPPALKSHREMAGDRPRPEIRHGWDSTVVLQAPLAFGPFGPFNLMTSPGRGATRCRSARPFISYSVPKPISHLVHGQVRYCRNSLVMESPMSHQTIELELPIWQLTHKQLERGFFGASSVCKQGSRLVSCK